MFRKTMIILATTAVLSGGLTANAVALAAAHTGWDGLGDGVRTLSSRHPRVIRILRVSSAANADTTRGRTGAPTTAP